MIRIVGLSATLPNYLEVSQSHTLYSIYSLVSRSHFSSLYHYYLVVSFISLVNIQVAQFLRVNPEAGLFYFDSSYRPVPLAQQYIGISEQNFLARTELLNEICYNKVSFFTWALLCNLILGMTTWEI